MLLPEAYGGGTLRGAINLAVQIHDGAKKTGDNVVVEFGYVDGKATEKLEIFESLAARRIEFRPFKVKRYPRTSYYQTASAYVGGTEPDILVFDDGISNFDDADHRIFISDRLVGGDIAPTSPYSIVIFDFLQRYIPKLFDRGSDVDTAASWHTITGIMKQYVNASAIFVTTQQAAADAIGFGGVPRVKVCKLPLSFDPIETRASGEPREVAANDRGHMVWTTNITPHKNHQVILQGLEIFYDRSPTGPITYVTGVHTENLDPKSAIKAVADVPYVRQIRNQVAGSPTLRRNVIFKGDLSNAEYDEILSGAKLLLHGAIFDNGTFSVAEAAWRGVPSVSSRYAAMQEMSDEFRMPLQFFDSASAEDMATALENALNNRDELVRALPTRSELDQFSAKNQSGEIWCRIKSMIDPETATVVASGKQCRT